MNQVYSPSAFVGERPAESLTERLDHEIEHLSKRLEKLQKAREILENHPELKQVLNMLSSLGV